MAKVLHGESREFVRDISTRDADDVRRPSVGEKKFVTISSDAVANETISLLSDPTPEKTTSRKLSYGSLATGNVKYGRLEPDNLFERKQVLRAFKNIVFDARGSRGGNGDVAAAYLTARDFLDRFDYPHTITILINEPEIKVLSRMYGLQIKLGTSLGPRQIQFHSVDTLPDRPPVDFYLQLAAPSGDLRFVDDLAWTPLNGLKQETISNRKLIPTTEHTIMMTQKVFGVVENYDGINSGTMSCGQTVLHIDSAGIGGVRPPCNRESGIYPDATSQRLRKFSRDEITAFLLEQIERFSIHRGDLLKGILKKDFLRGCKIGFMYGASLSYVQPQIEQYLAGLAADADKTNGSYIIFTSSSPKTNAFNDEVRKRLEFIEDAATLPRNAPPGKIFICKLGPVPHDLFVGLLARSDVPPTLAGDGALSEVVQLGIPFVMTHLNETSKIVFYLKELLLSAATTEMEHATIEKVFVCDKWDCAQLDMALELNTIRDLFARLLDRVPILSDRTIDNAGLLLKAAGGRDMVDPEASKDSYLTIDLLLKQVEAGKSGSYLRLCEYLAPEERPDLYNNVFKDRIRQLGDRGMALDSFRSLIDALTHEDGDVRRAAFMFSPHSFETTPDLQKYCQTREFEEKVVRLFNALGETKGGVVSIIISLMLKTKIWSPRIESEILKNFDSNCETNFLRYFKMIGHRSSKVEQFLRKWLDSAEEGPFRDDVIAFLSESALRPA